MNTKRLGCTESRVFTLGFDKFAKLPAARRERAARRNGYGPTVSKLQRDWTDPFWWRFQLEPHMVRYRIQGLKFEQIVLKAKGGFIP